MNNIKHITPTIIAVELPEGAKNPRFITNGNRTIRYELEDKPACHNMMGILGG